ncbi:hypothetical protein KKC63_00790 [Patescibacteria group bacterium]|nr:hypothetical protein [Patescibacteria group bacterium]MBU4022897.1 hypothetical protein [Patescibacteria group bacterium]
MRRNRELLRRLIEFLWPKGRWFKGDWRRKSWPRKSRHAHQLYLFELGAMSELTRKERRKIRHRFKQGSKCSSCGSLDVSQELELEHKELPIIRYRCRECGDHWHDFLLYGKWGWYHDDGMHDWFQNELASG